MRILLVDDDPAQTRAWERILVRDHHEVITANSAKEALAWLRRARERLDIALVDYLMPRTDGLQLIPEINKRSPGCRCVLVTGVDEGKVAVAALEHGAPTVPKPLHARTLRRLLRLLARRPGQWGPVVARHLPMLSDRETQVVAVRMEGLNNQEIADRLEISEGTVRTLWPRIFSKTGCRSQSELVAFLSARLLEENR